MIPQYNPYGSGGPGPFLFNATYDMTQSNEANLYDNIAREHTYLYGSDLVFLPREMNGEEVIFGEFLAASFSNGIPIRMFVEEVEAWGGGGDIYSKIGLQVTDECTLYGPKTLFGFATSGLYPKPNDLMYHVVSKKLYEIQHIEDETSPSFYLFGNRGGYKIQCKMFSFSHEMISTQPTSASGIPEAIQALDAIIENTDRIPTEPQVAVVNPDTPNTTSKDTTENINIYGRSVIDNTERDPLL